MTKNPGPAPTTESQQKHACAGHPKLTADDMARAERLREVGMGFPAIARTLGVTPNAIRQRFKRTGIFKATPRRSPEKRFERLIAYEPNTGCHIWLGATSGGGYGYFGMGGRNTFAHRIAYEVERSPIPEGMQIDHRCRNRLCVNPEHLDVVTPSENCWRSSPYRMKSHCKRGHPLVNDNVYINPVSLARCCRECRKIYTREQNERVRLRRLAMRGRQDDGS